MVADCEVVEGHGLKLINLSNLQLIFLPANVTSRAQPLDQGIIACIKAHYRRRLVKWMLDAANAPGNEETSLKDLAPTFYQMMRWVHEAWMQDVSQDTIANCWRHAGILPDAWVQSVPAQDGAALHVHGYSSTEDDSMPIAQIGAEQAEQSCAQAELQAALDELSTVVHNRALLAQGDVLLDAAQFMSLDGETEVIAEMSDAEIVQFVTTDGTNQADSDEGEEDDFQGAVITGQQAIEQAQNVHDYMLCYPDEFDVSVVRSMESVTQQLARSIVRNRTQSTLQQLWQRQDM
jgi:hypothetical protein